MKGNGSRKRQWVTAAVLGGVVAAMVGLAFASVPLYRLFCQVTGFAGTPKTEGVTASDRVAERTVRVRFDANVNSKLPWRFRPMQREVTVHLGEETLIHYEAINDSDEPITGTAVFNVAPFKAAQYFTKIECFCFTEQTLKPHERAVMPVVFYVDPDMDEDVNAKDVKVITLSYTFYPFEDDEGDDGGAGDDVSGSSGAAGSDDRAGS